MRRTGDWGVRGCYKKIILIVFLMFTALNFLGVCYKSKVILSKQDYQDIAVEYVMHGGGYKSVEEFYSDFPDCCEVFYWSDINSWNFLYAFFAHSSVIVKITWSYTDRLGNYFPDEEDFVVVTKCGDRWMTTATGD